MRTGYYEQKINYTWPNNVFTIWVKFIYGFLDIYQFFVYKIFHFLRTVVSSNMDDDIITLFLKIRN